MTLPTDGYLGMKQIAGEFGSDGTPGLKDYYATASGIPSANRIGIKDF